MTNISKRSINRASACITTSHAEQRHITYTAARPRATSKRSFTDALPRAYIETRWAIRLPYAPTRPHATTDGPRANAPLDRPTKTNNLQRNACGPWPWPSGTDGSATGSMDGMAPASGPHPPTGCEPNARAIQATTSAQFSAIQSNSMQFRSLASVLLELESGHANASDGRSPMHSLGKHSARQAASLRM